LEAGGLLQRPRRRRGTMGDFSVDCDTIRLTDQRPIIEDNIAFEDGWTLSDLIEALNRRVFFWRGKAEGLLRSNRGQSQRYAAEGRELVFLRMSFEETARANADRGPELCTYNSGAARKNDGRPSPRGPSTFVRPEVAPFGIGSVREVIFHNFVEL